MSENKKCVNFWDFDGYKNIIERLETTKKFSLTIFDLLNKNYEIQNDYAKNLKSWCTKKDLKLNHSIATVNTITEKFVALQNNVAENNLKMVDRQSVSLVAYKTAVNELIDGCVFKYKKSFEDVQNAYKTLFDIVQSTLKSYNDVNSEVKTLEKGLAKVGKSTSALKMKQLQDKFYAKMKKLDHYRSSYTDDFDNLETAYKKYQTEMIKIHNEIDEIDKKIFEQISSLFSCFSTSTLGMKQLFDEFNNETNKNKSDLNAFGTDLINWSSKFGYLMTPVSLERAVEKPKNQSVESIEKKSNDQRVEINQSIIQSPSQNFPKSQEDMPKRNSLPLKLPSHL